MFLSVIVIAYNRREYLQRALSSLFHQTLDRDSYEIILIKNFTDPVIDEICTAYSVRSILMEGTIGEYIRRGIAESTGDIITFLEDDDKFTEDKLEKVSTIYEREKFDFMKNGFIEIDNSDNERTESVQRSTLLTRSLNDSIVLKDDEINPKTLHFLISRGQDFNLSCMSISRSVGDQIRETISKISTCPDGTIFFLSMDIGQRFAFLPLRLTYYRIHESRSRSYASMEMALKKLENEGLEQSKSLLEIKSYIKRPSLIRVVEEVISIKNIRVAGLNPRKRDIAFSSLRSGTSLAMSGNAYAIAWILIFFLSLFPLVSARRVVFSYLKGL